MYFLSLGVKGLKTFLLWLPILGRAVSSNLTVLVWIRRLNIARLVPEATSLG